MNRSSSLGPIVIAFVIVLLAGQVALAQVNWTYEELEIPPGPSGSWNDANHHVGDIVFDGTTYHLYLTGGQTTLSWESAWAVGHWTSTDPKGPWTPDPDNPVLETEPGEWDSQTIYNVTVLYDGSSFRMWYGATDSYLGVVRVGLATNDDGFGGWDKHPGNPLAGLEPGSPGTWDDHGMSPNTVLFDGAAYGMWYTAVKDDGGYGDWRIGYASSADGLTWNKATSPLLAGTEPWEGENVYLPAVAPVGGGFVMWYSGLIPGYANIGYSVSPDGMNWGKHPANPILTPQSGCDVVDSFAVFFEGDTIHGWTDHCFNIWHVTSPFEVGFFDGFESGDTTIWGGVVP